MRNASGRRHAATPGGETGRVESGQSEAGGVAPPPSIPLGGPRSGGVPRSLRVTSARDSLASHSGPVLQVGHNCENKYIPLSSLGCRKESTAEGSVGRRVTTTFILRIRSPFERDHRAGATWSNHPRFLAGHWKAYRAKLHLYPVCHRRAAAPRSRHDPVSARREAGTAPRATAERPRRVCPLVVLAGLALAVPLAGQVDDNDRAEPNPWAEFVTELERFQLFTECAPVYAAGLVSGDEAEDMGLTKERVWTMVENRLRAARLYDSRGGILLEMFIETHGAAFDVSLKLLKFLDDPRSGVESSAPTWSYHTFGTYGGDTGFIMQIVSEALDGFILNYLRVNEGYC